MGLGYSSLGRGSCTCFPCNTSTKAHSSTHLWDAAKGTASSFLCPLSAPLGQPRPSHLPHHRGETRAAHRSSPKQPFLSPSFFAGLLFSELSEHMWLQHAGGSTWKWQGATSQLCNWEQGRRKALLEALLLLVGLNQLCNEIFLLSTNALKPAGKKSRMEKMRQQSSLHSTAQSQLLAPRSAGTRHPVPLQCSDAVRALITGGHFSRSPRAKPAQQGCSVWAVLLKDTGSCPFSLGPSTNAPVF